MDGLNNNITIEFIDGERKIALRTAEQRDLFNLRQWKNAQREFFFHKDEISPEQQKDWFEAYQKRHDDVMFIVQVDGFSIGCMGIRIFDKEWDVYNVILGSADYGKKGIMGKVFQSMLRFASSRKALPITLKVLKRNPAVNWYRKNGFVVTSEKPDHFCMLYQPEIINQETL